MPAIPGQYQIRSVTRALDVLVALSELGRADLSTVAEAAGLHPTTTLRMLESLRSRDFVRQRDGSYELGPRSFEIGSRFLDHLSLAREAQSLVEELASRVNETANLGILDGGEVLYLAIAHGRSELGIQSVPGGRHPAWCTALGKVLLADLPPGAVESILRAHPPERLTPSTIVEPRALRRELDRVARRGFALDSEERIPGVVCVAAPIRDGTGEVVAGMSISGPRLRLSPGRLRSVAEEVVEVAGRASTYLGATRDAPAAAEARTSRRTER